MFYRNESSKKPIVQHKFDDRPWSKIVVDLYELHGRSLLVIVDFYSNFIKVPNVSSMTSKSIIKELMMVFARFGIPDVIITDYGRYCSSSEFAAFVKNWKFDHVTPSPRYAQSNSKAENAVQTIKLLFKKCCTAGESEFQALLDW